MANKRISLIVTFVLWVAGSYGVYTFFPRWAIVVYGVVTITLFLILSIVASGKKTDGEAGSNG
jgi:hypothetical protein